LDTINNQIEFVSDHLNELTGDVKKGNKDLSECSNKVKEVERKLDGIKTLKIINRHHFLLFPDLRNWFNLIKRSYVILILGISLTLSVMFNVYQNSTIASLKPIANKYRVARAFSFEKNIPSILISQYLNKLDSIYSEKKDSLLKSTQRIEDSIYAEKLRKQRIESLQKELNNLKK
jgi:hypothetical protein